MDSFIEKRKRCPNWLPSEKSLLLELVEKHLNIVEIKKTGRIAMNLKLAEWEKIANKYNSQAPHITRSADNLRRQWEFMKKNARREESKKRTSIQTDEEPYNSQKDDTIHNKIMSLIKTGATGISNSFDSDSVIESSDNNSRGITISILEEMPSKDFKICNEVSQLSVAAVNSDEVLEQDWRDIKSEMLRSPVSNPLEPITSEEEELIREPRTSRRRPTYKTVDPLLQLLNEKKLEALDRQKVFVEKKRKLMLEARETDLLIKREQLKHERIKTSLLLTELRLKKKKSIEE